MKAKVSRGADFRGVLNYIFDIGSKATGKKKTEGIGGNLSGETVSELLQEFGITKKLRPDCSYPVWHCSLSLPEGERLSASMWDEISKNFLIEMCIDIDNFLYIVQRHNDSKHDHIHIVASRIGLDSSIWHGGRDVFMAIEATQKLEKKYGLTFTSGLDYSHIKERNRVTAGELNMAIRTETKPPRMVCQEAIDKILCTNILIKAPEFIARLNALGVHAVPKVTSTGIMNGFSFETEGIPFSGSKLGGLYTWEQLKKRGVEYVQIRDFKALADAERLAIEPGSDTTSSGFKQSAFEYHRAPSAGARAVADINSQTSDPGLAVKSSRLADAWEIAFGTGGNSIRAERPNGREHASEGRRAGPNVIGSFLPSAWPQNVGEQNGCEQQGDQSPDIESGMRGQGNANEQPRAAEDGAGGAPKCLADTMSDVEYSGAGGAIGCGGASRVLQAAASKRIAAARAVGHGFVEQCLTEREEAAQHDRIKAQEIDKNAANITRQELVQMVPASNNMLVQDAPELTRDEAFQDQIIESLGRDFFIDSCGS